MKGIETYLQTLESELGGLEAEQRDSELREMRQHIEAIVARLVEGGLSENEAIDAAIAQFGNARQVGRELQKVPRKRETLDKTAVAVGGALLCFFAPFPLAWPLDKWLPEWSPHIMLLILALCSFIAGKVATNLAPQSGKRAVLWVFSFLFAIEPLDGFLQNIPYWLMGEGPGWIQFIFHDWHNDIKLVLILLLIWLGATINLRHTQSRDLTKA